MSELQGPQKLGPLTPLVGHWEGNDGVDVSFRHEDDDTTTTGYFETAWFKPIPTQNNGNQALEGLKYGMVAWRHGEEAMDPFHDEIGYLLWDTVRKQVMRNVVFGRGIAILAGGDCEARGKKLNFDAKPGDPNYGILQNKYLTENAELINFESSFTFSAEDTLDYEQTLVLRIPAMGEGQMDHTDRNTLHRVKRISESIRDA